MAPDNKSCLGLEYFVTKMIIFWINLTDQELKQTELNDIKLLNIVNDKIIDFFLL